MEEATLNSLSKNHIDIDISVQGWTKYRLTGIYGEPDRSKRRITWDLIKYLHSYSSLPWCLIGDMNNVLCFNDKKGGKPYPRWLVQGFQDVVEECGLTDMAMTGYPYTWERHHGTDKWVEIRLDRALVSSSWLNYFQGAKLVNLEITTSDHCPILLDPSVVRQVVHTKRFRFENAWLREPMCKKLVNDAWEINKNQSLQMKLVVCATNLAKWGQEITGSFKRRIKHSEKIIRWTKGRRDDASIKLHQEESRQLHETLIQQEVFWKQRCKQLWLKEGDQNIKYFHAATKARRKANHIKFLKNENNEVMDWSTGLQDTMVRYFENLYRASNIEWDEVVECISQSISPEQNDAMLRPVEEIEVKKALFHMHPDKAAGPDGISPGFYKKFWGITGGDIVQMVKKFFDTGVLDENLPYANIVLIPKKKCPETMADLRPISLCNVLYKIISKVLANRLKEVIDKVISDTQSAFISGRLITDNIMILYEIMYYMKRKNRGKKGWMALKLDMSKAYDRIEWGFLKAVLVKMDFDSKLVNLFMICVTYARYRISHAGREFGYIIPDRRIRQGDPLSSYLFLICMEGLFALIRRYEVQQLIKGVQVARGAPKVSHIFFADDSYVFCRADPVEANHVTKLLSIFERASGQQINSNKSSVFFSYNTDAMIKNEVCESLQFQEADDNCQYLGLPNIIGRNKTAIFGFLKERLRSRLQGWDKKYVSKGGKEILLKTVAQALPNYAMSMFLIPMGMCKEMERMMCKYWWQSTPDKATGIHWMSWERMCRPKSNGGIGFRNIHDFNVALLGKQAWRLLTQPDKLVSKIFKSRYYPNNSFLDAKLRSNPSYIWRSILEAQNLIKQGATCRVGNGRSVNIFKDPWLPCEEDPYVHTANVALNNKMVDSLMVIGQNRWDSDLIDDVFEDRDANLIYAISLHNSDYDSWYWRKEKLGFYSVKSAYILLQNDRDRSNMSDNSGFWHKLWNLKVPLKVKNFIWRTSFFCLPTKVQLRGKHVDICDLCPICNEEPESVLHVLVTCSFSTSCWNKIDINTRGVHQLNFAEWLDSVFEQQHGNDAALITMVAWAIWKCRNEVVWHQKSTYVVGVVESAKTALNQWRCAQDKTFDNFMGFMTAADGAEHWKCPIVDTIKINVDAAIFNSSNYYSYDIVARDCQGKLIEARAKCVQGTITPENTEAIAIREALSWIKDRGWHKVELETDCLTAVQAIRGAALMLSYFGRVIEECKQLIDSQVIVLNFVKRSANTVAHFLARNTYLIADRVWTMENTLPDLVDVMRKDLMF